MVIRMTTRRVRPEDDDDEVRGSLSFESLVREASNFEHPHGSYGDEDSLARGEVDATVGNYGRTSSHYEATMRLPEAVFALGAAASSASGGDDEFHTTAPGGADGIGLPFSLDLTQQGTHAPTSFFRVQDFSIESQPQCLYLYDYVDVAPNWANLPSPNDTLFRDNLADTPTTLTSSRAASNNIITFGMPPNSTNHLSSDEISSSDESQPRTPGSFGTLTTRFRSDQSTGTRPGNLPWTVAAPDLQASGATHTDASSPSTQMSTSPPQRMAFAAIGNPHTPFYSAELPEEGLGFGPFRTHFNILSAGHQRVMPTIDATKVKGMKKEEHWTCYRRNYMSVSCSYSLATPIAGKPIFIEGVVGPNSLSQVQSFALKLTANMDTQTGKEAELFQYNPKRDAKSPVKFHKVYPRSRGNTTNSLPASECPLLPRQHEEEDDCRSLAPSSPRRHEAVFERIQFGNATQNNGKRRQHQQFYYLVMGLYADIRSPGSPEANWVKVAHTLSDRLIVRGRSPGHYNGTSASSSKKQGGSAGGGGSGGRTSRGMQPSYRPASSSGGSYSSGAGEPSNGSYSYNGNSYSGFFPFGNMPPPPSNWHVPKPAVANGVKTEGEPEPMSAMSQAEEDAFNNFSNYQYYPGPLSDMYSPKPIVKPEFHSPPSTFSPVTTYSHQSFVAPTKLEAPNTSSNHRAFIDTPTTPSYMTGRVVSERPMSYQQRAMTYEIPRQTAATFQPGLCSRFQGSDSSRGLYPPFSAAGF